MQVTVTLSKFEVLEEGRIVHQVQAIEDIEFGLKGEGGPFVSNLRMRTTIIHAEKT